MVPADPTLRLREVPWPALRGLQDAACAAIAETLRGAPAERVVDRLLRAHRSLTRDQRAALVEAVFGVALWRRRLVSLTFVIDECQPRSAALLLAALLRDLAGLRDAEAAALAGLTEGELQPRRIAPVTLALRWSLPDWIAACLQREVAGEADALCAALNAPGPICLRANTLRLSREALQQRLAGEGLRTQLTRWSPLGLHVLEARPNLLGLGAQREALFEVQDEGSQLVGLLTDARPGQRVLDFCAGAGGKTLLLAGELGGEGELHAHDVDQGRLLRLERRAARAGVEGLLVHRAPPPAGLRFDRVLVDAPCSELGALRRGPDARFLLREEAVLALPALQGQLLARAAVHVGAGGRLVYATCTLRREENEEVVEAFLRAHPSFALRRAWAPWLAPSMLRGDYFLCLPHRHGTDGFFAAVMDLE